MSFDQNAKELGIEIPKAPKPVAAYVPGVLVDGYLYTSGQLPFVDGELKYKGKVGAEVSDDDGYEAAKVCAINCLGVVKSIVGSLDKVEKIMKINVFVNSEKGFIGQAKIANGASELLGKIFNEVGQHARSAIGVSELPADAAVEVDLVAKIMT